LNTLAFPLWQECPAMKPLSEQQKEGMKKKPEAAQ
jgi:hypothetical protein